MDTQEKVEKHWEAMGRGLYRGGAWVTSTTSDDVADGLATKLNERAELIAALNEFLVSGVEFDDPRMGYVVMQIDRDAIKDARALLDRVNKQ